MTPYRPSVPATLGLKDGMAEVLQAQICTLTFAFAITILSSRAEHLMLMCRMFGMVPSSFASTTQAATTAGQQQQCPLTLRYSSRPILGSTVESQTEDVKTFFFALRDQRSRAILLMVVTLCQVQSSTLSMEQSLRRYMCAVRCIVLRKE